jgi:hypothetical protein
VLSTLTVYGQSGVSLWAARKFVVAPSTPTPVVSRGGIDDRETMKKAGLEGGDCTVPRTDSVYVVAE